MNIVAVTACPTGIAHTYMAAESLEIEAKSRGWSIKVETQGSMGRENELTVSEIEAADVVVFAVDMAVEGEDRFVGKSIIKVGVADAIKKAAQVMNQAQELINK
jgi:fructose-specific PTS system IIB-like component